MHKSVSLPRRTPRPLPPRQRTAIVVAGVQARRSQLVQKEVEPYFASDSAPPEQNFVPDANVDYARTLTAEGGIAIAFKDLDKRLRILFMRVLIWFVVSALEGRVIFSHAAAHNIWTNIVLAIVVLVVNWLIVSKPVEIYRTVEVRPDCMILDEAEVFWRGMMETGWPAFQAGQDGQILCGIYGTRFVEYLTVRKFDDLDRAPEVFAAHLQEAMKQMWSRPL